MRFLIFVVKQGSILENQNDRIRYLKKKKNHVSLLFLWGQAYSCQPVLFREGPVITTVIYLLDFVSGNGMVYIFQLALIVELQKGKEKLERSFPSKPKRKEMSRITCKYLYDLCFCQEYGQVVQTTAAAMLHYATPANW